MRVKLLLTTTITVTDSTSTLFGENLGHTSHASGLFYLQVKYVRRLGPKKKVALASAKTDQAMDSYGVCIRCTATWGSH